MQKSVVFVFCCLPKDFILKCCFCMQMNPKYFLSKPYDFYNTLMLITFLYKYMCIINITACVIIISFVFVFPLNIVVIHQLWKEKVLHLMFQCTDVSSFIIFIKTVGRVIINDEANTKIRAC